MDLANNSSLQNIIDLSEASFNTQIHLKRKVQWMLKGIVAALKVSQSLNDKTLRIILIQI